MGGRSVAYLLRDREAARGSVARLGAKGWVRVTARSSSSRATEEEPFLRLEVGAQSAARACEAPVGAVRVAHRVCEPSVRREAILPPDIEHVHACVGPIGPRLDPADEPVPERSEAHTSRCGGCGDSLV
jgi:hypothetical protein